ncbi:hypothetical protein [Rubrobacter aplysinae]|uniref:hypothetical protein n=1 Tax=Rubrobacter aplysinae TaxID=909625 RepID=UPI00128D9E6A|nr:hypothetical protein [Rubrobacter aplysinae]
MSPESPSATTSSSSPPCVASRGGAPGGSLRGLISAGSSPSPVSLKASARPSSRTATQAVPPSVRTPATWRGTPPSSASRTSEPGRSARPPARRLPEAEVYV